MPFDEEMVNMKHQKRNDKKPKAMNYDDMDVR